MTKARSKGLVSILNGIVRKKLFSPSLIVSVSELEAVHKMSDQFSTLSILTSENDAPLIQFATRDLCRAHRNVHIVTFEECIEKRPSAYQVIVVSKSPSILEVEAVKELLDVSLQVNDVDLVITSNVFTSLKIDSISYQLTLETRRNLWNHYVLSSGLDSILDEDESYYDNELIEDEDRIMKGEN
jgi:hypothetical protein